ncbi:hypothetical protein J5226_12780 [Lysobacter sp. K5869]|uniref:hypothetical protein n=1 Tax=Lysobacter sp. K5869 TaxID=2820808 RepID=UPI001C0603B8|nr:hypothetical protein [Lysobacter sp. K5869]QWP79200.1 hypothetical protein J5226_12780 [Lysobacter sp. K5869]
MSARDFHVTTDWAGETADARAAAVTACVTELMQDDAEVLSALGSLENEDYDALDAQMVASFRSGDWTEYTALMQRLVAARLRRTAERQVDAKRYERTARAADAFADMLQRPRAVVSP